MAPGTHRGPDNFQLADPRGARKLQGRPLPGQPLIEQPATGGAPRSGRFTLDFCLNVAHRLLRLAEISFLLAFALDFLASHDLSGCFPRLSGKLFGTTLDLVLVHDISSI
jgi:hypothetical protein